MKILIHSASYKVSEPYQPGHSLGPAEASTLNALRAERIRDIAEKRNWIHKTPTWEQHQRAQINIRQLDSDYTLSPFASRSREAPIDLELEIVGIARLKQRLAKNKIDLSKSEFLDLLQLEMGLPEVWEEARSRLLLKQASVATLEDLL